MSTEKLDHMMIDIESLGNKSFAIITAIAAVPFNMKGETGEPFEVNIDIQTCIDLGLKIDGSTIRWWFEQEEAARKKIYAKNGQTSLQHALRLLSKYFNEFVGDINVWGNSNRFDMGIIENAYTSIKKQIPWDFRKERDVRTLVWLAPHIKKATEFEGVKHDPKADCYHQIKYVVETFSKIQILD